MKGRSCLTNLLEFFEDITSIVGNREPVDVVYLDFQKAFDKVLYQRLLHKIEVHNVTGNALAWIENWLTKRKQKVG